MAQQLPERIATKKTLVVANVPNYPPLEFKDPKTGTLTGLDIDLGNALAKKLGIEIKWEEISFEQMVSALTTGRADMILSGMSDLPGRRDTLDFVDYLESGAQFYTTNDRKDQYKTLTDLCGKTVGASRRTSFPNEMETWSKTACEGAGKPPLKIVGTEGSADARTQLRQKRLDAAVQGSETLPYLLNLEPNTYAIIGEPFTSVHQGMAFAKPLVVQGERAFWQLLTPESLPKFLDEGWYALGDGVDGPGKLAAILGPLSRDKSAPKSSSASPTLNRTPRA